MPKYADLSYIKEIIQRELRKFETENPSIINGVIIDLFLKTLLFDVQDSAVKFEGLQSRVPLAFTKVLANDIQSEDLSGYFPDFAKVESFFQKILYFTNRAQYNQLTTNKKGLASYISALSLNPNGIQLTTTKPESVRILPHFAEHLSRVYQMRNLESHNCVSWSKKDLFENIESTLIIYLYATYKNQSVLKHIVDVEPNLNPYFHKVVSEFETWQRRFVHITGVEQFEEIDIYAVESDEWLETGRALREGRIDDLRKTIVENSMVVLGEPGMGKSTTLQYIAYKDAQRVLYPVDAGLVRIPVYLELKLFSLNDKILQVAAGKLGVAEQQLIDYLKEGRITCLLDGLNEVLADLRKPIRNDIEQMINTYPNASFIITSRPLAYSNEFKNSPVFILQRMEDFQIEEFLDKNCPKETIRSLIINEIKRNIRLGKIVRVPLLLKMLINVVLSNKGIIPGNKVQIIKKFIQNLYERENKKLTLDIDIRTIHRLLCFIAFKTREVNGANVGWQSEDVEAILEDRIEKSRFKVSVYEFLDFAIDLNILVKDGKKYSFIHELYQEYYASEEIYRINAVLNGGDSASQTLG